MKQIHAHEIKRFRKPVKKSWWIPLWKGLVFDSDAKHRLAMGTSIWLYLYLLFSVSRKTAIVTRKQRDMAADMGFTVTTIQKQLTRLKKHGYITMDDSRPPKITVTKWKLFKQNTGN